MRKQLPQLLAIAVLLRKGAVEEVETLEIFELRLQETREKEARKSKKSSHDKFTHKRIQLLHGLEPVPHKAKVLNPGTLVTDSSRLGFALEFVVA